MVPYFYLIELVRKLDKSYEEFFSILGCMQGRAAVSLQKNIFGVKTDDLIKFIHTVYPKQKVEIVVPRH
jgi:hypothetical protein